MFLILLRIEPSVAFLFFFCSHMRSFTPSFPVFFSFSFPISKGQCLKDLVILPRGPLTVTTLALISTFTPSGTGSYCSATMYFIIFLCGDNLINIQYIFIRFHTPATLKVYKVAILFTYLNYQAVQKHFSFLLYIFPSLQSIHHLF